MSKENENVLWCIAHSHSHQEKRSDLGGEPWNYRAGSQGIFDLSRGSSQFVRFAEHKYFIWGREAGCQMGVNLIFKIAAVGILVSVVCQVLKHSGREEQAFLTSLAGLILVLFWMVPYIYELFETIKDLFAL